MKMYKKEATKTFNEVIPLQIRTFLLLISYILAVMEGMMECVGNIYRRAHGRMS